MSVTDALIIGAGPFGLSISAHLRELRVDHVIVGRTMDTWRSHMPAGMYLKSEPYGSWIASPKSGYDISTYSAAHGLEFIERVQPTSLKHFLGYADWFAEQLVPDVRDLTVTKVTTHGGGFKVEFAEAEPIVTQQVVVATGVLPHRYLPDELSALPSDFVTHASDHHSLAPFQGRRIAVIGAGQSALETAALLHEQGAAVNVIARGPALQWARPNPEHLTLAGRIRRPVTKLCEGWWCVFDSTPAVFRLLPEDKRVTIARTFLGPSGSWWLRDRVEGVIDVLTNHRVREATPQANGVRLTLDGATKTMDVDHVVAGTGFHVDVARLSFLPQDLLGKIPSAKGYPVLSRAGESAVPGLYFAGALAAGSLGPSERFIAGTHNAAAVLARSVARRAQAGTRRSTRVTASNEEQPAAMPGLR
jgi:FAD-dependent urate hydroxylase